MDTMGSQASNNNGDNDDIICDLDDVADESKF